MKRMKLSGLAAKVLGIIRNPKSWPLVRPIRIKIKAEAAEIKYQLKRHYHLHLQLKKSDALWRVESHFARQDNKASKENIEYLHGTLKRCLVPLQNNMRAASFTQATDNRAFRGAFVKSIRLYRGLSREQLCRIINCHPALTEAAKKHGSLWSWFPLKAEFLEQFEERTNQIFEEITMGSLGGVGFPTETFTRLVAQVCRAQENYKEFRCWYSEVEIRKILSAKN